MVFETQKVRQEGAVLFADIAAPPMNLLGTELVRDLVALIQTAEADDGCQVLVFTSADPDYFISHVDVTRVAEYREHTVKLTGEASLGLLFRYLSGSRLVTIAQIEGRVPRATEARGALHVPRKSYAPGADVDSGLQSQEPCPNIHLGAEREVDGTAIRDLQQSRPLTLVQDSAELDVAFDHGEPGLTGFAIGTVLSVNA